MAMARSRKSRRPGSCPCRRKKGGLRPGWPHLRDSDRSQGRQFLEKRFFFGRFGRGSPVSGKRNNCWSYRHGQQKVGRRRWRLGIRTSQRAGLSANFENGTAPTLYDVVIPKGAELAQSPECTIATRLLGKRNWRFVSTLWTKATM